MKKNKKVIISYILAFILSLFIIAATILGYINNSVFNEISMRRAMRDTNYYYNIYSIIKDTAKDNVLQSGFRESVLDGVITDIKVQSDMNIVVECLYNNQKVEINTDEIRKKLDSNIQKQLAEHNYVISEDTQADINEFENSIINSYKSNMYYSQEIANKISSRLQKIREITNKIVIILCVLIVVLAFIIIKINEPMLGVSFIISGVFFIIIKTYSGVNLAINNILILNWAFSRTATYILNNLVQKLFVTGIVLLAVGLGAIILTEYMKNKKNY